MLKTIRKCKPMSQLRARSTKSDVKALCSLFSQLVATGLSHTKAASPAKTVEMIVPASTHITRKEQHTQQPA